MTLQRIALLSSLAMIAFAGNSLLCRLALKHTSIDPTSFTSIRLLTGAIMLWLIGGRARPIRDGAGNWGSAFALFVYAIGFSFAYVSLPTATGALLLFGAVQITMIGHGLWQGEKLTRMQWLALCLALGGLIGLMLPGLSAPPLSGALLMTGAGMAWGVYSLRGRSGGDPTRVTAGNFIRAVPIALFSNALFHPSLAWDASGVAYAVLSGTLASGIGYAIWYAVMPAHKATTAATIQLSVPVLSALGGILFLGEPLSWRLILTSLIILGGIALFLMERRRKPTSLETPR